MRGDSDDYLVRYLLGDVPVDEAERLDERGITDDEFALRLRALENDLVDRIARGQAPSVSSPYLRDRVQFAEALYTFTSAAKPPVRVRPASNSFAWPGLAAAAILFFALAGYLGLRNTWLRGEIETLQSDRAAIERQNMALQEQLARTRAAPTAQASSLTATVLLRPPRRGPGNESAIVSIPRGTDQVVLRVELESDRYPIFWAGLRDASSAAMVWRSRDLRPEVSPSGRTVTLAIPADTFSPQLYSVELTGVSSAGSSELLAHYPIRVVLE